MTLHVTDDASGPATQALLASLSDGDARISWVSGGRVGSAANFARGLARAPRDVDALLLADQDDVWDPDKASTLVAALDAGHMLVHSDARLVDADATGAARDPLRPRGARRGCDVAGCARRAQRGDRLHPRVASEAAGRCPSVPVDRRWPGPPRPLAGAVCIEHRHDRHGRTATARLPPARRERRRRRDRLRDLPGSARCDRVVGAAPPDRAGPRRRRGHRPPARPRARRHRLDRGPPGARDARPAAAARTAASRHAPARAHTASGCAGTSAARRRPSAPRPADVVPRGSDGAGCDCSASSLATRSACSAASRARQGSSTARCAR